MKPQATIKDVAKLAGVSTATVSNVLTGRKVVSEELKKRVSDAMKQLEYKPNSIARSLKTNLSYTIGVIAPDILNPFFAEVLKNIGYEANMRNYQIVMHDSGEDPERERKLLRLLLDNKMDGIIDFTSRLGCEEFIRGVPIPMVLGDVPYFPEADHLAFVRTDNFQSGKIAAEHLIQKEYKRFLCIAGPVRTASSAFRRLQGFRSGLYEHGFSEEELQVFECNFCFEDGYRLMDAFLDTYDPRERCAAYISSDIMAWGAMEACKNRRIQIPGQLGIIGNDNIWCSQYIAQGLTTIDNPASELGRISAKILLDALAD